MDHSTTLFDLTPPPPRPRRQPRPGTLAMTVHLVAGPPTGRHPAPADVRLAKALKSVRYHGVRVRKSPPDSIHTIDAPLARCDDAPAPGRTGTSRDAAASIAAKVGAVRDLILGWIRDAGDHGMTAEEVGHRLAEHRGHDAGGATRTTASARVSELNTAGLIRDSGRRRQTVSRCGAIVWVIA